MQILLFFLLKSFLCFWLIGEWFFWVNLSGYFDFYRRVSLRDFLRNCHFKKRNFTYRKKKKSERVLEKFSPRGEKTQFSERKLWEKSALREHFKEKDLFQIKSSIKYPQKILITQKRIYFPTKSRSKEPKKLNISL